MARQITGGASEDGVDGNIRIQQQLCNFHPPPRHTGETTILRLFPNETFQVLGRQPIGWDNVTSLLFSKEDGEPERDIGSLWWDEGACVYLGGLLALTDTFFSIDKQQRNKADYIRRSGSTHPVSGGALLL